MKHVVMTLGALAALGLGAGCASMGQQDAASINQITGDWRLIEIGGDPIGELLPVADRAPTIVIGADGLVAGFAGVNRYTGMLDLEALGAGRFSAGPFASTKMAGPGESMAIEARYLDLLDRVDRVTATGGLLRLHEGDATVLKFKRE